MNIKNLNSPHNSLGKLYQEIKGPVEIQNASVAILHFHSEKCGVCVISHRENNSSTKVVRGVMDLRVLGYR